VSRFAADVRSSNFPAEAETYPTPSELLD